MLIVPIILILFTNFDTSNSTIDANTNAPSSAKLPDVNAPLDQQWERLAYRNFLDSLQEWLKHQEGNAVKEEKPLKKTEEKKTTLNDDEANLATENLTKLVAEHLEKLAKNKGISFWVISRILQQFKSDWRQFKLYLFKLTVIGIGDWTGVGKINFFSQLFRWVPITDNQFYI